jgi:hypothetical protein
LSLAAFVDSGEEMAAIANGLAKRDLDREFSTVFVQTNKPNGSVVHLDRLGGVRGGYTREAAIRPNKRQMKVPILVRRKAILPNKSGSFSSTSGVVKRAVIEFWSVF